MAVNEICWNVQIYLTTIFGFRWVSGRAGRCSWGKIILSQEQPERSSTIPSFQKNNKWIECFLKNVGTICKGAEQNGAEIFEESLKSGRGSYYQECVLSRECILNQGCVLNHLEIIERFLELITWIQPPWPSPHSKPAAPLSTPSSKLTTDYRAGFSLTSVYHTY